MLILKPQDRLDCSCIEYGITLAAIPGNVALQHRLRYDDRWATTGNSTYTVGEAATSRTDQGCSIWRTDLEASWATWSSTEVSEFIPAPTSIVLRQNQTGKYGAYFGNQQFTARNLTFNNANTAVYANWNWGWTFQGLTINNAQVRITYEIV